MGSSLSSTGELPAGKEFAGWAPHGRILGETNCKEPGDRHGDLCKSLAPRLAGCLGVQVPLGWGTSCRRRDQEGQRVSSLRRTQPLHPLWALAGS